MTELALAPLGRCVFEATTRITGVSGVQLPQMPEAIHFEGTKFGAALGFGTTSLMELRSSAERLSLLEYAFDLGIHHFDTAPYYGYGEAERIVGRFIRSRRDRVTVTTKFGIQPPSVAGFSAIAGFAKRMTRGAMPIRRFLSRQAGKLVQRDAFSVSDARKSLEASLRTLGTSYIDVYLLHEANPAQASEDLLAFLEDQVRKGVIRCFGIGAEFKRTLGFSLQHPAYTRVLQFENNVFHRNIERLPVGVDRLVITHGALRHGSGETGARLRRSPKGTARWSALTGVDCADESTLTGLMLTYAVQANPSGVVLFSSKSRVHLASNLRAVTEGRFSSEQISALIELIEAHPCGPTVTWP